MGEEAGGIGACFQNRLDCRNCGGLSRRYCGGGLRDNVSLSFKEGAARVSTDEKKADVAEWGTGVFVQRDRA